MCFVQRVNIYSFARAKDRRRVISWYYDIFGLIDFAAQGCHFCVPILSNVPIAEVEALNADSAELNIEHFLFQPIEKRLRAETCTLIIGEWHLCFDVVEGTLAS